MKKNKRDRHLETPAEANRDKHINFVALEAGDTDPADLPASGKLANRSNDSEGLKDQAGRKKKNKVR